MKICIGDSFIKRNCQPDFSSLGHDHVAAILFEQILQAGVIRIIERHVNLFNLRQIKQTDAILLRAVLNAFFKIYIIGGVFLQRGQEITVGCTFTATTVAGHGDITPIYIIFLQSQVHRARNCISHPGNDGETVAPLHFKITWLNANLYIRWHIYKHDRLTNCERPD